MLEEQWSEIEGFPDYAVSNHGRVVNIHTNRELQPRRDSYGNCRVTLRANGSSYDHYVHHLVASAYVTGYVPGVHIRHHDGDKTNNYVENLRFKAGKRLGQLARNINHPSFRRIRIVENGMIFRNVEDCSRYLGGDPSSIYRVLRGERMTHKGYTFEYFQEP